MFCFYFESQLAISADTTNKYSLNSTRTIFVVKNISSALVSVFSASFLSSFFIEVRQKNDEYRYHVSNDFIVSKDFHDSLSDENKKELKSWLIKGEYFNGSELRYEMINGIKEKLDNYPDYYFDKLDLKISCKYDEIEGKQVIKKAITKTITLKSFSSSCSIDNYLFLESVYADSYSPEPIAEIKVSNYNNNRPLVKDKDYVIKHEIKEKKSLAGGYYYAYRFIFNKKIRLGSKGVKIEVSYNTFADVNDRRYVNRVPVPCKKYTLAFTGPDEDKDVCALAYGFVDDATTTPVLKDVPNSVSVAFDDWIFPRDGVVICF